MRLLVTGAGGTLGSTLAETALKAGHEVTAPDRESMDITDALDVIRAVNASEPEAVVNCAAFSDVDAAQAHPREALAVNRDGARNVAKAAAEAGAAFVHISTDYVFDGKREVPYLPQDRPAPLNLYGISKLAGEMAVQESHGEALILRTSWIFGGHSRGFVAWVSTKLREAGPALQIVEDQQSRPTWCRDLAQSILALIALGATGVHHVADRGHCTRLELAREVQGILGTTRELLGVPGEEFGAPARRPHYSVLDLASTEALLGRDLPYWQESLRKYFGE